MQRGGRSVAVAVHGGASRYHTLLLLLKAFSACPPLTCSWVGMYVRVCVCVCVCACVSVCVCVRVA